MGSPPQLLEHQQSGIPWLRDRSRALLADEPGLGKSAQLLLSATEPVLITAPAMVLDSGTWDDEIDLWAPGIEAVQIPYTSMVQRGPRGRIQRDGNGAPVVSLKPELRRHWGTVIADESHYLKGRKTSWTVVFKKLDTDSLRQATGTPIPNWAHEAFTTLQLLYPEEAKPGGEFGSYWRWARKWFHVGSTHWSPAVVGGLCTEEHIAGCAECWDLGRSARTWEEFRAENWRDRILLRLRADCLDLPPLTEQQWMVKMAPEQARVYKSLKKDFVAWLDSGLEVVAWNSAAQLIKLAKAATGLDVLDPSARSSGKLDALRGVLADRPRPTLVVGHFRDTVAACARAAEEVGRSVMTVVGGGARKDRREAIRAFQSGGLDVLCATIDTISEGMTLHQGGADQVIRVERSWRPSRNEQVMRRLHRIGQENPVSVIDLVSRGTVDERVLALLGAKTDEQMQALGTAELKALA